MRYLLLLTAFSGCCQGIDLGPHFMGRSGAALLWDLREERLVGSFHEERAKTLRFRPGSLSKPFTLASFIEAGLYQDSFRVRCEAGILNGVQALAYSCNEYFDKAQGMLEAADFKRGYARFGLEASATETTLAGLLPAYRRLVLRSGEARLAPVFEGMAQSVAYGTGRLAAVAGARVAGKTGTMRGAALFAGFAPAEKPRYLLLVHMDVGSGGGDAAPVAAKIFASALGAGSNFEAGRVKIRLFWQNPPQTLNLAAGDYPAGTKIEAGSSKMAAPGALHVEKQGGKYLVSVSVALEDYVAAVLHGEAGGFRNVESRKAMAVAARTYAVRFRGRHMEEGFDLCDTTHCQDARFVTKQRLDLVSAVEATDGELLWWQGKPAAAYYHADSGGWLEVSPEGGAARTRKDPWWRDVPEAHWSWSVAAKDLAAALHLTLIRPGFQISAREVSGRARALDAFGHPAEAAAFRMAVGRELGWEKLPSRLFTVNEAGEPRQRRLLFEGMGRGHGMGMPQTSAERMAEAGKNYREILREYYPEARVNVTASGLNWQRLSGSRVSLFTVNVARDRGVLVQAERVLPELEKLTGMKVSPVIRVYPSRDAFRDATGILGPVQGATRGAQVKLPPGAQLSTVRHELVHALLESNTKVVHPGWFREGLVLALLGEEGKERAQAQEMLQKYGKAELLRIWREGPALLQD